MHRTYRRGRVTMTRNLCDDSLRYQLPHKVLLNMSTVQYIWKLHGPDRWESASQREEGQG